MSSPVSYYDVASVVWKNYFKKIRLEPGSIWVELPLSACVTKGDRVWLQGGELAVQCLNGEATLLPSYIAKEDVALGAEVLPVIVKEITDNEEYNAYESLSHFHYRGRGLHGRSARLILRAFHPSFPQVIGYIELTSSFYMNKARTELINAPFEYGDIMWDNWGIEEQKKYIHLFVRIARCVVYPEFRGIGLGKLLIEHAAEFAKNRWQMAGYKPYFLEISADMLKYVPFAEHAGMVFIGETEGNLSRVHRDMEYLLRNASRVEAGDILSGEMHGIVDKQLGRMQAALQLMEDEGFNLAELVERLKRLSQEEVLRDYALFHKLISLPKPTYIQGLNISVHEFVLNRAEQIVENGGHEIALPRISQISDPINLHNVTITYESEVRRTQKTHAIQQAFGISPNEIKVTIIKDLSLSIEPGEIVLIVGASGSGKTTLLECLAQADKVVPSGLHIEGTIYTPDNYQPGVLKGSRSRKALIEVLGSNGVTSTLNLMGIVGLSDAYVYLRRYEELSKGQQFRAMLAYLIASQNNVWLIDELFTNLDLVTANVVADKLQKTARQLGATVIAAAPHSNTFVRSLRPDKVIKLTSAWEHSIVSGKSYIHSLPKSKVGGLPPTTLRLSSEYLEWIKKGRKTSTVRKGRLKIQPGELLILQCGNEIIAVQVEGVFCRQFKNLDNSIAVRDGFQCAEELRNAIHRHYNHVKEHHYFTVINFHVFSTHEDS